MFHEFGLHKLELTQKKDTTMKTNLLLILFSLALAAGHSGCRHQGHKYHEDGESVEMVINLVTRLFNVSNPPTYD